jgi:hypothetical protein
MEPELDPQVKQAVEHPAQTARGPEEAQLRVRLAGEPARRALGAHWDEAADAPGDPAGAGSAGAGSAEDRFAAAVLLATLFGDTFWLRRAAELPGDVPGCPSAPPRGLLELTRVPGARAALAPVLERSLLTGLLEWGTNPLPEQPPAVVAQAVRDLGIPDEGRVYRMVRRRAERFLAREYDGSPELERFVALLAEAEKGPHEEAPVLEVPPAPPVPPAPGAPGQEAPGPASSDAPGAPRWDTPEAPHSDAPEAPHSGTPRWDTPEAPHSDAPEAPHSGTPRWDAPQAPRWGTGPMAPGPGHPAEEPEDDTDNLKAWGVVFLVILAIILVLALVL